MSAPYTFDEFFSSGAHDSVSPFLEKKSRKYATSLKLKSAILSAIFLVIAFVFSFISLPISNLFTLFVFFLSATPALIDSFEDIRNFELNIDILMTLAAFFAVIIGSPIEGALLLVLFDISGSMEDSVTRKARGSLRHLNEITSNISHVIRKDGTSYERATKDVEVETKLLIKVGEIVPLDGKILEGESYVNLVHLTGESLPVSKKTGDDLQAGSLNLDGTLIMQVTKTSQESTLSKMIDLINKAQETKPKLQKLLDRFEKRYATTIIVLFAVFAFGLPLVFSMTFWGYEGSIYRALTFLIAASPCALIIATPTAYLSSIGSCAKNGILLKGGVSLDALAKARAIAFDKTGTLTTGKLRCVHFSKIEGDSKLSDNDALSIANALEMHAKHPVATAICEYAQEQKVEVISHEGFKVIPGHGIESQVELHGKQVPVFIGNKSFIEKKTRLLDGKSFEEAGKLVCFMLLGSNLYLFHFNDELREGMNDLLVSIKKKHHLELYMLTGDHRENAQHFAEKLSLDKVYSELNPEDKLEIVSKLAKEKDLAMVGDGINDAPALMRSHVGISMGKIGSGAAIDASDIVFLHDDIKKLDFLIDKSKMTLRIIKQNLSLALGVIICVTTPALLGFIPLWLAVVLHEGGTLIVGLNSLRLLKK